MSANTVLDKPTAAAKPFNFDSIKSEADAIVAKYERKHAAMLPVLHLVQQRQGYITTESEQLVARFLDVSAAHVHEVVTFYTLFHREPVGQYHVQICMNVSCALRGAEGCMRSIADRLGIKPGQTSADGKFTLSAVECLCACEAAPMMQVNDRYVGPITPEVINALASDPSSLPSAWPAFGGSPKLPEPVLSKRFNAKDSASIETYVRDGGYQAARKALTEMAPERVIEEVSKSNLRGLGGAGFPTGKKWSFIPKDSAKPKFLVVNADEGEPGTFKDRYLMERDPHRLIEGMIIAGFATGCRKAYIYVRGEYIEPARIMERAIEDAKKYGFLGSNIFNTKAAFDIVVHRGAGAYICGEETALLSSLEGGKGFPRLKPPFPAISGLFASPTVINNVETLACVPAIILKGGEWFAKLGGVERTGGTRLFSLSGHVAKPGLYEAPHSVTLRELIFDYAGGIPNGRKLKAVIPGGVSAKILTADEIDVKMDFDSLLKAGTMAGSAGVMVLDDATCIVKALYYASKFFAHESCGQCSPCREGCGWLHKIISRLAHGQGRQPDLDILLAIAGNMEGRTICVFADAAAWPVQSYIAKFRSEFENHIRQQRCPTTNAASCMNERAHA